MLSYNPEPPYIKYFFTSTLYRRVRFGLFRFRSPLLTKYRHNVTFFSIPLGTEMFYFPRYYFCNRLQILAEARGFPHSEISGSKVVWHLPEAYRSYTPSFIVTVSQGIHHMLLNFLLGNLKTTITYIYILSFLPAHLQLKRPLHMCTCTYKLSGWN